MTRPSFLRCLSGSMLLIFWVMLMGYILAPTWGCVRARRPRKEKQLVAFVRRWYPHTREFVYLAVDKEEDVSRIAECFPKLTDSLDSGYYPFEMGGETAIEIALPEGKRQVLYLDGTMSKAEAYVDRVTVHLNIDGDIDTVIEELRLHYVVDESEFRRRCPMLWMGE